MAGWTDRKDLSPITAKENYIIQFAWQICFLRESDMPITQLNPLSDDEGPLVTFMSTGREIPAETIRNAAGI